MERKEMLAKLSQITAITANMVCTYDMGMEFDLMTSKGITTIFGSVGNWPCCRLHVTEELIALKNKLVETGDITSDDILAIDQLKNMLTYSDWFSGSSFVVENEILENCVANIKVALKDLNTELEVFYAFVCLEHGDDGVVEFFETNKELNVFFAERYGEEVYEYEKMTDEQLQYAYDIAEAEGWDGISYNDFVDDDYDEEE